MASPDVCKEFIRRMTEAIVFGRNNGISEMSMRDGFDHVMLHVEVLDLREVPPIPKSIE